MTFSYMSSLCAVGLLLGFVHDAVADTWTVARLTGKAWLVSAEGHERLQRGTEVPPGLTIETTSGARVLLVQGETSISIGPNSVMAISALRSSDSYTTVLHQLGQLDVDVEKRAAPHLEVVTPFLAAVVKGTRFQVGVTGSGASVAVVRGLVSVSDYDSGDRADVGANQTVTTSTWPGDGLRAVGPGTKPTISKSKPSAPPIGTVGNIPAPGSPADTAEGTADATAEDVGQPAIQGAAQTDLAQSNAIADDIAPTNVEVGGKAEGSRGNGGNSKAEDKGKGEDRDESKGARGAEGEDRDGAKSESEGKSDDRDGSKTDNEGKSDNRGGSKSEREGKSKDRDGSKSEGDGKSESKGEGKGKGKDD